MDHTSTSMEFPQQQKPAGDGKIIYPPGVKEITDKISNDEVVKRLKVRLVGILAVKTPFAVGP